MEREAPAVTHPNGILVWKWLPEAGRMARFVSVSTTSRWSSRSWIGFSNGAVTGRATNG